MPRIKDKAEREAFKSLRKEFKFDEYSYAIENAGYVSYISLEHNDLEELPERVNKLPNLRKLQIGFNRFTRIHGLVQFSKLQDLGFYATEISKIEGLDHLPQLKRLRLFANKIKKIENLDKLSRLEYLNLCANQITKIEGLEKLSNLRVLILSHYLMLI